MSRYNICQESKTVWKTNCISGHSGLEHTPSKRWRVTGGSVVGYTYFMSEKNAEDYVDFMTKVDTGFFD